MSTLPADNFLLSCVKAFVSPPLDYSLPFILPFRATFTAEESGRTDGALKQKLLSVHLPGSVCVIFHHRIREWNVPAKKGQRQVGIKDREGGREEKGNWS